MSDWDHTRFSFTMGYRQSHTYIFIIWARRKNTYH